GRDAKGKRVPADFGEPVAPQSFGQGFALGKLLDTGRQVVIGIVFAPRDRLTDARQYLAEVKSIEPSKQPAARLREFENSDLAPWLSDAPNSRRPGVSVGHIPQAERYRRDLEMVIGKRQPLGVGLEVSYAIGSLLFVRLLAGQDKHLMAEICANNRYTSLR